MILLLYYLVSLLTVSQMWAIMGVFAISKFHLKCTFPKYFVAVYISSMHFMSRYNYTSLFDVIFNLCAELATMNSLLIRVNSKLCFSEEGFLFFQIMKDIKMILIIHLSHPSLPLIVRASFCTKSLCSIAESTCCLRWSMERIVVYDTSGSVKYEVQYWKDVEPFTKGAISNTSKIYKILSLQYTNLFFYFGWDKVWSTYNIVNRLWPTDKRRDTP